MLIRTAPGLQLEIFMEGSSNLPRLRTKIMSDAIAWGADKILTMDTDHTFPPEALLRLISLEKPIVGATYARRSDPIGPMAYKMINGRKHGVWNTKAQADAEVIEEVDSLGLGLCLIDAAVMSKVSKPWFALEEQYEGEDFYFFVKVREAGVPVYLDHALSWHVGHIDEALLMNEHAVADFDRFKASIAL
jgi:hypothetical protein